MSGGAILKKVHVMGALGAAPLAMALAWPAMNAAAAVTNGAAHGSGSAAKKVLAFRGDDPQRTPLAVCGSSHIVRHVSAGGQFSTSIGYSNSCVHYQAARLGHKAANLTERVKYYSKNGALERTVFVHGNTFGSSTFFSSTPNIHAHQVCQALVLTSNHNTVKYGPICTTIG